MPKIFIKIQRFLKNNFKILAPGSAEISNVSPFFVKILTVPISIPVGFPFHERNKFRKRIMNIFKHFR